MIKQQSNYRAYRVFIISFFCILQIYLLDLSSTLNAYKPDLIAMCIVFWVIKLPYQIGVTFAFLIGIMYDLINGGYLGLYAGSLSATAYVTSKLHTKIKLYAFGQQVLLLVLLISTNHLMHRVYNYFLPTLPYNHHIFKTIVMSTLCWPVLYFVLDKFNLKSNKFSG